MRCVCAHRIYVCMCMNTYPDGSELPKKVPEVFLLPLRDLLVGYLGVKAVSVEECRHPLQDAAACFLALMSLVRCIQMYSKYMCRSPAGRHSNLCARFLSVFV